jgi:hypothetical protein
MASTATLALNPAVCLLRTFAMFYLNLLLVPPILIGGLKYGEYHRQPLSRCRVAG